MGQSPDRKREEDEQKNDQKCLKVRGIWLREKGTSNTKNIEALYERLKSGRQIDQPTFTSEDENTYCCVAKGSNLISGRADRSVFLALYLGKCLGQLKANKA